ncbi:MAG: hypothetical protein OXE53_03155 [Deltaproteobacteria bacterium]|nr:hypothetical protein [Deltaproteobacteria bacterium]
MPRPSLEDPKVVALLAGLVRTFRAGDIEMRFDGTERTILDLLSGEGLVDLSNDGFRLTETGGSYAVCSQVPPVTPKGILFLERLPIDEFADRPGLFRFLGWL